MQELSLLLFGLMLRLYFLNFGNFCRQTWNTQSIHITARSSFWLLTSSYWKTSAATQARSRPSLGSNTSSRSLCARNMCNIFVQRPAPGRACSTKNPCSRVGIPLLGRRYRTSCTSSSRRLGTDTYLKNKNSKLLFVVISALLASSVPHRAVLERVPDAAAAEARTALPVQTLLVLWTLPGNVAFDPTIEAQC